MYSNFVIVHDGAAFDPNGRVTPGDSQTLACGHARPPVAPGAFTLPWGIVTTANGPEEYCIDCCDALEVAAIAQLPDDAVYFGYYNLEKRTITTWHGTEVMRIISSSVYYHNFGGRFVAITAVAPDGREWHGRASFDWGECIRLRRSKGNTPWAGYHYNPKKHIWRR